MLTAIVFALGPFGCPSDPEPEKAVPDEPAEPALPDATNSGEPAARAPEQKPQPKDPQPEAPEQLNADVAQSKVRFLVTRAVGEHIGHFEKFSSTLELTDGKPSKLEIAVKTGSVEADRQGLTSHLKSADFFHVDQFPTARFTTDTITPMPGDEPNRYTVKGTMSLHGVEGKLEFPAIITVEPERVLGSATLDISAKAFGIDYAGMEAELAEDAVGLQIELVFPR
jgi:polyisoprenoid-binding protein YceI